MDIPQLAAEVAKFLAPFLPYLILGTEAAAKEAGKRFGKAAWEKAAELWGRLKPKVEEKPSAREAIEKAARKPQDKRVLGNLEVELEEIFEQDISFAQSIRAGDYSVVIGGDMVGSKAAVGPNAQAAEQIFNTTIYEAKPTEPGDDLTQVYLRHLAQDCEKLPLGFIHRDFQENEGKVLLHDIYTDLDVKPPIKDKEYQKRRNEEEFAEVFLEREHRVPVLEALTLPNKQRIVLLGDAGSDKTTCVHYLAAALAELRQNTKTHSPLPEALTRHFPIRLILREVASAHIPPNARDGNVDVIWKALRGDLTKRLGADQAAGFFPVFQKRVQSEPCLIMFDGLDEVPEAEERRACLLKSIELFCAALPAESIVLVTARPYAYDNPQWRLQNFETMELLSFSAKQVERFIARFYRAIGPVKGWDEQTWENRGASLHHEVEAQEYLQKLAERPLLLTLIASVDVSGGKLPEDRADLYEETVGLLSQRWQRRIETHTTDGELLADENVRKALSADPKKLRDALNSLAYNVHERQGREPDKKPNAPADIRKEDILGAFAMILTDVHPGLLLDYLEKRAGLLIGRGDGAYAFPHRSFQEYLAACHLADQSETAKRLQAVLESDPEWWREVVLLGIAKIQRGGLGNAVNAVNALVPCAPEELDTEITQLHWHTTALAGQALLEMRLPQKSGDVFYTTIIKRVAKWLAQLLEGSHLTPRERAEAGNTLAKLGDPRFDESRWQLPKEPLLGFVHISAGEFLMGTKKQDIKGLLEKFGGQEDWYKPEVPQHKLHLPDFYMARHPVTVAQFKEFVRDSKYEPANEASLRGVPNHPVRYVTWFDALEYCKWLNEKLKEIAPAQKAEYETEENFWQGIGSGKLIVTLPSEAEWEKAARGTLPSPAGRGGGGEGRIFPWGDEITPEHANYADTNLNTTSAVGAFPKGESPYGLQDMSGNVWEWTRSIYKPYKYDPKDGRENLEEDGESPRVLRGGAFDHYVWLVRCASRLRNDPHDELDFIGFRVVVVSHFS
ncbi:MAG: NACHT domain-containing protein [Anaerolineaceae bacterium]|nr:MAG: NACHT domain-containing protein [Anaerolineaceae bacterium]